MATSSIKKNFVVYGEKQAETFANAIEQSMNSKETFPKIEVKHITGNELLKFMEKRKKKLNE